MAEPSSPPAAPSPGRRRAPMALATAVAVAIIAVLVVGLVLTSGDDDGVEHLDPDAVAGPSIPDVGLPSGPPPSTGGIVPDVTLDVWSGEDASLADFTGGPLVVNFFASWCAPCVAEMPDFESVHQELGDQVGFLGVNREDSRDRAEALVDRTGVTYPLATDSGDELLPALGAVVMPTTVFIDADGTVLRVHSGSLTAGALRQAIAEEFDL